MPSTEICLEFLVVFHQVHRTGMVWKPLLDCNQTIWKLIPHSISESLNVTGIVTETQSNLISSSHRHLHPAHISNYFQLHHRHIISVVAKLDLRKKRPGLRLSGFLESPPPIHPCYARPNMRTQACRTWASQAMNLSSEAPPQRMKKHV